MNEDKAVRYHRLRRRTGVLSVLLVATWLTFLLTTGLSVRLREIAEAMTGTGPASPLTVAVYVLALSALQELLGFPIAWYRSFRLEHRYGLSFESLRAWTGDHLKSAGIGLLLALGGAEVVYLSLRTWPETWWIVSAGVFVAALLVLARLAPVLLMPLFYRLKPLEREALTSRLVALSTRAGVPVLGVYEWGLGEKTRRANAALVGTGGTRRVLLSDTLLADYTDDEIEVILAHELGHHAHRDILKGLVVEASLIAIGFYLGAAVLDTLWSSFQLAGPADVAGLPLLLLTAGCVSLMTTPIVNALSRRNERRADRFALAMTDQTMAFVSAMKRLALQNLAEPSPSKSTVWLFHTHPAIEERIRTARRSGKRPDSGSAVGRRVSGR